MKTPPFFFLWAILLVSLCQPLFAQQDSLDRQAQLYKLLQNIQTEGKESDPYDLKKFPKSDFQVPAIKARFLELLTPTLNEQEKQAIINKQIEFSKTGNEHVAKKIIKKDTTKEFAQVYDSLMKDDIELSLNQAIQSHRVNEGIIHVAGWLDIKDAIPYLENLLQEPKQQKDRETILLSLARLQKEPYYSDMVKKYSDPMSEQLNVNEYFIYELAYIGTQESIYAVINLLDSKRKVKFFGKDILLVYRMLSYLSGLIRDESFLKYFEQSDARFTYEFTQKDIDFTKAWLEAHKGNIKFNRDLY